MHWVFSILVHTMHIGDRIKKIRSELGLTQAQLAERMGKNVSWIKNAETRTVRFTPDDIVCLADALGVPARRLTNMAA